MLGKKINLNYGHNKYELQKLEPLKKGNVWVVKYFVFSVSAHDDKDYHPNVTSILLLKPLPYTLIQKSLLQSILNILNPLSDLKASSVTQYFPGDTSSSHPPHTTTGFKALGSAQRMWQESKQLFLLFTSAAPILTCADIQTCFRQNLSAWVKVRWLECFIDKIGLPTSYWKQCKDSTSDWY